MTGHEELRKDPYWAVRDCPNCKAKMASMRNNVRDAAQALRVEFGIKRDDRSAWERNRQAHMDL